MNPRTASPPNLAAAALLAAALAGPASAAPPTTPQAGPATSWVATWTASPQPVWEPGFLFPSNVPPLLHDQTVRQVARVSLGGQRLRIVLSNAHGKQPVTVGRATLAHPRRHGVVDPTSLRTVTFGGRQDATIPPGASVLSDPVALPVAALAQVAVSLYLPGATSLDTFHWDGRQTAWIAPGDQSLATALRARGDALPSTTARVLLAGIQVDAPPAGARAVAVLGDSITDGATATLDQDSRWPDFLATRLAAQGVAVVNAGISGARLLSDGMGVNALARLERDVLAQPGVRSVVVMLGINDIAWPGTAFAPNAAPPTLQALTAGYRQLIERARSHGLRVLGATLTPFEGALPGTPLDDYHDPDKDALRQRLNDWIRHSGAFDAVIDFDAALRDPHHPARIAPRYDSGDHLHPGDAGNRAMAEAVDPGALLPGLNALPPHPLRRSPE